MLTETSSQRSEEIRYIQLILGCSPRKEWHQMHILIFLKSQASDTSKSTITKNHSMSQHKTKIIQQMFTRIKQPSL